MIAGHSLAGWLGNRAAQDATLARLVEARHAWQAAPDLQQLTARLDEAASDAETVAGIAHDILADDGLARRYVSTMLRRISADPFFTPPLRHVPGAIGTGVRLFEHRHLTLSLVVIDADALAAKKGAGSAGRAIAFSGRLALRRMLCAGGVGIQRFAAEPAGADLCLASQPPCRVGAREQLADGDLFIVDGRRESFTFLQARAAVAYIECEVLAGGAPFRVEYDAVSLRPIGASSTDEAGSRCQLMLSALRALDGAVETSLYNDLLEDRSFEVRWHALRELMLVAPQAAWSGLRRLAAGDSHREIRAAAARLLVQAEGGVACHS